MLNRLRNFGIRACWSHKGVPLTRVRRRVRLDWLRRHYTLVSVGDVFFIQMNPGLLFRKRILRCKILTYTRVFECDRHGDGSIIALEAIVHGFMSPLVVIIRTLAAEYREDILLHVVSIT